MMEYQKIANLLDNTLDQPFKFWTKNWVEVNDESKESYGTSSNIRFKTTMLRSNLCDSTHAYILVKWTITITGAGDIDAAKRLDERNKGDNAQDIYILMPMYNLSEYSDNYSKTSGSLWQYYKDNPNDNITQSESFKSKIKIKGKTPAACNTKDIEISVLLKYLSNFWRTLKIVLINCEVNLILTWSSNWVISSATGETKFRITDTKLYVSVVTLSTQDNAKLLQQLKSGFKRIIN